MEEHFFVPQSKNQDRNRKYCEKYKVQERRASNRAKGRLTSIFMVRSSNCNIW